MISNQILQNTIDGIKEITQVDLCVVDVEGKAVATTFEEEFGDSAEVISFVNSQADSQIVKGFQFFKVCDDTQPEFVVIAMGDHKDLYTVGRLASYQIQSLLVAYKERFDKDNFVKNLLMDNLLSVDIHNRAKKLDISIECRRVVYIVEVYPEMEYGYVELLQDAFSEYKEHHITAIDEHSIILVRDVLPDEDTKSLDATAVHILELINISEEGSCHVAYGNIVPELKDVSKSYKEARMALDVGKIFYDEKKIIAYSSLGIGRLIYQLPIPLCRMFIKEIFESKSPDDFDKETIATINKFFENSLNVSETSRQLYIHRNTLVYRLDKLQKSTGLDLRVFEDAITLKIALMVVRYMKYMETLNQ